MFNLLLKLGIAFQGYTVQLLKEGTIDLIIIQFPFDLQSPEHPVTHLQKQGTSRL